MSFWKNPTLIHPTNPFFSWIVLLNVTLVTSLVVVSSISASIADSSIAGALMMSDTERTWLSTGYLAACSSCLPLSGWLGRRYGIKFAFFVGFTLFVLSSLLAGWAPTFHFS